MDSKEILETFGISKNFGIVLLIQSIIVIVGCFFAIQSVYLMDIQGNVLLSAKSIVNLLFFLVLLFYSFYAYRKNENYFKWVLYLFAIFLIVCLIINITSNIPMSLGFIVINVGFVIKLLLLIYFILKLNEYSKAKIAILLLVLVEVIVWIFGTIGSGISLNMAILWLTNLIPCVSIALTYFARYNDKGFKILL